MSILIEKICDEYQRHKLPNHPTRHGRMVQSISVWFGKLQPQDITRTVISAWRLQRGVSDSSARRELGTLMAVLRWGQRHRMFDLADMPVVDLPPHAQAKQVWMDTGQEEAFWKAAQGSSPDVAVFTALALDTAARKSAILGLTWDRVDLKQGLIDYREAGMRITNKRRIPVPINSRLFPVLTKAWMHTAMPASGFVVKTRNIDKPFRAFATSIGYDWVTPHICRHTWACLAAQGGMPMYHIAKMLGDTLHTVENNYAHLAPSHLRAIADWRFATAGTTP